MIFAVAEPGAALAEAFNNKVDTVVLLPLTVNEALVQVAVTPAGSPVTASATGPEKPPLVVVTSSS